MNETRTDPTQPTVLHQDRHLLIISKPAGLLSQGDKTGDTAAATWGAAFLGAQRREAGKEGGNPFIAPAHRLDRPVSGTLVMACTSKAAKRLHRLFLEKTVHKSYLAIVEGTLESPTRVRLWLSKNRQSNKVDVRTTAAQGFKEAVTLVQPLHSAGGLTLVAMAPLTGRSHQLRVTAASMGTPIVGDVKYGSRNTLGHFIALHACVIRFPHPVGGATLCVRAPLPSEWSVRWPELLRSVPDRLKA